MAEPQFPLSLPSMDESDSLWGPPPTGTDMGLDVPFSVYNKGERLSRLANWLEDRSGKGQRGKGPQKGGKGGYGKGSWGQQPGQDGEKKPEIDEDEKDWETANYDKTNATKRFMPWSRGRGKGTGKGHAPTGPRRPGPGRGRGDKQKKKMDTRLGQLRYTHVHRQSSVEPAASWTPIVAFNLPDLSKLENTTQRSQPTDLKMCGEVMMYNPVFDRLAPKAPVPLRDFSHKTFYSELALDDDNLRGFSRQAKPDKISIFATDAVLATLMTANKAVMPWDVVVTRIRNIYFIDRREDSSLEHWTVNETAHEPPPEDSQPDRPIEQRINCAPLLAFEATVVSQAFAQQILTAPPSTGGKQAKGLEPHPFADDGDDPAAIVYRYRKWEIKSPPTVPGGFDYDITVRCQADGCVGKRSSYFRAFALNEYQHGQYSWRNKLATAQGAVMATEIKNNACKLAKWTCLSLLAGCDTMKLGFITRTNPSAREHHQVLQVLNQAPRTFAQQIGLQESHMWSVFTHIVRELEKARDGEPRQCFVILKDPNKNILRIYATPLDAFDGDESDSSSDSSSS